MIALAAKILLRPEPELALLPPLATERRSSPAAAAQAVVATRDFSIKVRIVRSNHHSGHREHAAPTQRQNYQLLSPSKMRFRGGAFQRTTRGTTGKLGQRTCEGSRGTEVTSFSGVVAHITIFCLHGSCCVLLRVELVVTLPLGASPSDRRIISTSNQSQ